MDKEAARRLLDKVLGHAFDESAFRELVRNVFKDLDERQTPPFAGAYIYDSFRNQVRQFKRIAKYTDPDGEEIDVLAVALRGGTQLERARTMQRNFVAEYLKRKEREAALVAFYTDDRNDWRLSFVRLEYRTEEGEDGRVRVTPELTPARRYSFLVGEGEPSHTAQQQLFGLLTAEDRPTLDDLEHAFEIERVTKAFFDEYKDLFLTIKEDLDDVRVRQPEVEAEFQRCGLTSEGFAKKLLGQIVFLYFVQKKGWLGVPKDASWGEGPKDFLRRLFEKRYGDYTNFFDDRLEPLFYEALAAERGADSYYHLFECRIPFLNGGLFEPPGGYAWDRVPLHLPDRTFEKVLDTFDRYNFTVREDEPLEKEVAVDPEMLGKVFENLLEVKDRKAKGAFYTPREIVAYMCNESLIAYLDEALNNAEEAGAPAVPRADLEALVRQGERWAENDRRVQEAGRETDTYRWAAPEAVRTHAAAIDRALADIAVCDPAIGSGAFPVGMMQAVVRVREALSPYLPEAPGRTAYAFKRHAIEHCLYGVDIEPSAVDIAQLRLWLSLVVDEDDFQTIQPLPNLRYKIVEGDALGGVTLSLENNAAYDRLQRLIPQHVRAYSPREKERLQHEIDALIRQITGGVFDFNVYFGDVLHRKGGFDVVIGNPPYVRQETLTSAQKERYKNTYQVYAGSADLYAYFIERGMTLLRPGGVFAYIVSNKWLRARYGTNLRRWLKQRRIVEIIDFGDLPVFQGATTYPCIVRLKKAPPKRTFRAVQVDTLDFDDLAAYVRAHAFEVDQAALDDAGWALVDHRTQRLLDELGRAGTPLGTYVDGKIYRGVLTGLNKAFVIDARTRQRLLDEDPRSAELI
ncbi:MAG: class I SAM-dependent DNA methyltransferase, partial [Deltaproteobacteria bacterium]